MRDRTEENKFRAQQKLPLIYCPFDCGPEDVASSSTNAFAYCCHLVGFTRDANERVFEPVCRSAWANGEHFSVNGRKPEKVKAGDVVINPIVTQRTSSGINYAKLWVSARVYRECTSEYAAEWKATYAHSEDFAVMQELEVDDKDARIRDLEEELQRLKGRPGVLGDVGVLPSVLPECPWHEPTAEDLADEPVMAK